MQSGNRFRLYPTSEQEKVLLRWIGCQRFIYNAKVSEDRYFRAYARKFASYELVPIDQEYSRFIGPDTEWLRAVPSQVLRNGAVRWRQAYQSFSGSWPAARSFARPTEDNPCGSLRSCSGSWRIGYT